MRKVESGLQLTGAEILDLMDQISTQVGYIPVNRGSAQRGNV